MQVSVPDQVVPAFHRERVAIGDDEQIVRYLRNRLVIVVRDDDAFLPALLYIIQVLALMGAKTCVGFAGDKDVVALAT